MKNTEDRAKTWKVVCRTKIWRQGEKGGVQLINVMYIYYFD